MSLYALDVGGVVRDLNANQHAWPNDLFKVVDVTAIAGIAAGWAWNGATYVAPVAAAPTQAALVAYAGAKQAALRDGGITVNVGTAAAPVVANVTTDAAGIARVTANIQMIGLAAALGKPAPTFCWDNGSGQTLSLNVPQMQSISWEMNTFLQASQTTLGTVLTSLADAAITTAAQVDAATWPATSY